MTWRRVFLVLGILALAVQCYGLYGPPGPSVPSPVPSDKVSHFVGFAVPVALFVAARVDWRWVVGVAAVQAVASELVQGILLPERSGDPLDLLADAVGIAAGVGLGRLATRKRPSQAGANSSQ